MKIQSKVTGQEPMLTDFALYNLFRNNEFDCTKAQEELGFHCRPFEETIRDEVAWLREEAANAPELTEEEKQTAEKVRQQIKMGDVARVIIRTGDEDRLSLTLEHSIAAGVGGVIFAPYAVIPSIVAGVAMHAQILLEKKDGTIVDINGNPVEATA